MNEKIYYSAEDIAKMLGVSMGKAYNDPQNRSHKYLQWRMTQQFLYFLQFRQFMVLNHVVDDLRLFAGCTPDACRIVHDYKGKNQRDGKQCRIKAVILPHAGGQRHDQR